MSAHTPGLLVSCKGQCDQEMQAIYEREGYYTAWNSIADLAIREEFLRWKRAIIKRVGEGNVDQGAFEKIKKFVMRFSPIVTRETTPEERERLVELNMTRGL